jgi:protein-tyrosine-phosphatase
MKHSAPTIIFVCEHGAAKSIIAAAYFNQLDQERGLEFAALARGTNPDPELSPKTILGLQQDGLTSTETKPQMLSIQEVVSAQRVISFCDLPVEYQQKTNVEQWEAVPTVSEDYEKARDAILAHLNFLMTNL